MHERLDHSYYRDFMDPRSDAELLQALRDDDRGAWDVVVARHTPRLWAIARSQGMAASDADDAVQTVWLALLDHRDRIRKPESLAIWLTQVLKHEVIRVGKQGARTRPLIDEAVAALPDDKQIPTDEALIASERRRGVTEALSALSASCQRLLRLLFAAADLSYADIAVALDCPIGSIGPTRARCLASLRRLLDEGGGISGVA